MWCAWETFFIKFKYFFFLLVFQNKNFKNPGLMFFQFFKICKKSTFDVLLVLGKKMLKIHVLWLLEKILKNIHFFVDFWSLTKNFWKNHRVWSPDPKKRCLKKILLLKYVCWSVCPSKNCYRFFEVSLPNSEFCGLVVLGRKFKFKFFFSLAIEKKS